MNTVKSFPVVVRNLDQEFLDQAFFIALPFSLKCDSWTDHEGKRINNVTSRVKLAWGIADQALYSRKIAPPPVEGPKG